MKALLKIGFVAAFCLAGTAAFAQEPVKTAGSTTAKPVLVPATTAPAKKTDRKAAPAQKATPPSSTRQKTVAPAKKEEIQPVQ
jgi:hypothetical protein